MVAFAFLLTLIALAAHDVHAAFNYTFASPSRTPHPAAYTVLDVTPAPYTVLPSEPVRQFSFFRRTPTPSASVTVTPRAVQSAFIISPSTPHPVKTPTPLPNLPTAGRAAYPLPSPSPTVTPGPSPTTIPVPIITTPSTSSQDRLSPSLVKRVIAVPLDMPQRQTLSPHSPEHIPQQVQHDLLMPPTPYDHMPSNYVAPLPPHPSASDNLIPVEIRFQKHIHASPIHMPSPSSAPSQEPLSSDQLMPLLDQLNRLASTYEPAASVTQKPSSTLPPTITPKPTVSPPTQPTFVARTLRDHRFRSINTKQRTVHCVDAADASPSAKSSSVPSTNAMKGAGPVTRHRVAVKLVARRRFPVRKQHRRRIPLIRVKGQTAPATSASPSTNPLKTMPYVDVVAPSATPSKAPTMYDAGMVQSHRISSVKTNVRKTPTPVTTPKSSIENYEADSSRPVYRTYGPTPSMSLSERYAQWTPVIVKSSSSPTPSHAYDVFEDTKHFSIGDEPITDQDAFIWSSSEPEEYCDSVKQCMCAVLDNNLLSTSLLSYCSRLDALTSSVCEQSKQAHIFFEFWRTRRGTEGIALVNECAPDIIKIW